MLNESISPRKFICMFRSLLFAISISKLYNSGEFESIKLVDRDGKEHYNSEKTPEVSPYEKASEMIAKIKPRQKLLDNQGFRGSASLSEIQKMEEALKNATQKRNAPNRVMPIGARQ